MIPLHADRILRSKRLNPQKTETFKKGPPMPHISRFIPALTAASLIAAAGLSPVLSSAQTTGQTTDQATPPSDMGASSSSCSSVQGYPDQSTNRSVASSCFASSSSDSSVMDNSMSASSDSQMSDASSMSGMSGASDSASSSWSASSSSSM
jgi:hypothetical protein